MTSTSIYQDLPLSYVYRLDNPITGEFYIGFRKANKAPASQDLGIKYFTSSRLVKSRFHEFVYTIIQEFVNPIEAYDLEQLLIHQEFKNPLILNRVCHHEKQRFIQSMSPRSEEHKAKISASLKGKKQQKISTALSGKKQPNISIAKKGKKRKTFSEKHKSNMSEAKKGKSLSEDHKAKISYANKGKPAYNKGKPRSIEANEKQSVSAKGIPKPKSAFLSIIDTRKTYNKQNLSRYYPEFKQYY